MFRWARHASWALLGAGLLVLVANAVWPRGWGPAAVVLLMAGYAAGVVALVPIIAGTVRAFFDTLAALLPAPAALPVAVALLLGAAYLVAWAWIATPW
jgi:hypothetical protein